MKTWREKNSDHVKQYDDEYRKAHREERREYNRQWRKENRDYWRQYQNERLRTNLDYRLRNYIGRAIRKAINKNRKSVFNILGYSVDDLRHHLESLFQTGMTWENYGKEWHLDHVIPKSWFELETEDGVDEYELKACWALRNLQPLWAIENLKKKNSHISQINLGKLSITYEQFRILIEGNRPEAIAFI
jgi:hypothetical protein